MDEGAREHRRRGNAVTVGKQHVKDGVIYLRTEKKGCSTEVPIPLHPTLAATREARPTGVLHFIRGESGKPLTNFSRIFVAVPSTMKEGSPRFPQPSLNTASMLFPSGSITKAA